MTQIIAAMTPDYVILASDRRLTFRHPPFKGKVKDDDTCKLVSLYGVGAIGYTGYADLEGVPTHEWIATRLAEDCCKTPLEAARILAKCAARAISLEQCPIELTFLYVGWWPFGPTRDSGLKPYFLVITNVFDEHGARVEPPRHDFVIRSNIFDGKMPCNVDSVGHRVTSPRLKKLHRNILRAVKRNLSPKHPLMDMVQELRYSAGETAYVGSKALAVCIPRASAENFFRTGKNFMLATDPNLEVASFSYFDPNFSRLRQCGPTSVFGSTAFTITTGEDGNSQFTEIKFVHLALKPARQ